MGKVNKELAKFSVYTIRKEDADRSSRTFIYQTLRALYCDNWLKIDMGYKLFRSRVISMTVYRYNGWLIERVYVNEDVSDDAITNAEQARIDRRLLFEAQDEKRRIASEKRAMNKEIKRLEALLVSSATF